MNSPSVAPIQFHPRDALRAEAAIEPDPVPTGAVTKETQIIAIYGKGGIGKSFTLANLSYMMAQQGKKVLLIGCDPKSDTTSLLFGGRACPTIIETSSKKKLAGEAVAIGDVCFKRDGVYAMELGGPEVRTFRELMELMLEVIARRRLLVPVPWWLAALQGTVLGLLPNPLLTRDQVRLLETDNVVSPEAIEEGRTFAGLGIQPQAAAAIIPSYLWQYRPAGQFTPTRQG